MYMYMYMYMYTYKLYKDAYNRIYMYIQAAATALYMYKCVSYSDLHILTVFWAAGSEVLWSVVWWRAAAACPRGASETAGGRPPA